MKKVVQIEEGGIVTDGLSYQNHILRQVPPEFSATHSNESDGGRGIVGLQANMLNKMSLETAFNASRGLSFPELIMNDIRSGKLVLAEREEPPSIL